MDAIKYIEGRKRMLETAGRRTCWSNDIYCEQHPELAVRVVEKWVDENPDPRLTVLNDFVNRMGVIDEYKTDVIGTILNNFCPFEFGYDVDRYSNDNGCDNNCKACWNALLVK